jgi:hypothetical protein
MGGTLRMLRPGSNQEDLEVTDRKQGIHELAFETKLNGSILQIDFGMFSRWCHLGSITSIL